MEAVLEEREEVPMSVVLVEEEIAGSVQQQAQGANDEGVGFTPVANSKEDEKERYRVEEVKDILPLREEIPLIPDQALWVLEDERLNRKKDKHRQVRQCGTDERVAVEVRRSLPTQECDVNDGVGLSVHGLLYLIIPSSSIVSSAESSTSSGRVIFARRRLDS